MLISLTSHMHTYVHARPVHYVNCATVTSVDLCIFKLAFVLQAQLDQSRTVTKQKKTVSSSITLFNDCCL